MKTIIIISGESQDKFENLLPYSIKIDCLNLFSTIEKDKQFTFLESVINEFSDNEKILIIKNLSSEYENMLKEDFGAFEIYLVNKCPCEKDIESHDFVLNTGNINFDIQTKQLILGLTKEK